MTFKKQVANPNIEKTIWLDFGDILDPDNKLNKEGYVETTDSSDCASFTEDIYNYKIISTEGREHPQFEIINMSNDGLQIHLKQNKITGRFPIELKAYLDNEVTTLKVLIEVPKESNLIHDMKLPAALNWTQYDAFSHLCIIKNAKCEKNLNAFYLYDSKNGEWKYSEPSVQLNAKIAPPPEYTFEISSTHFYYDENIGGIALNPKSHFSKGQLTTKFTAKHLTEQSTQVIDLIIEIDDYTITSIQPKMDIDSYPTEFFLWLYKRDDIIKPLTYNDIDDDPDLAKAIELSLQDPNLQKLSASDGVIESKSCDADNQKVSPIGNPHQTEDEMLQLAIERSLSIMIIKAAVLHLIK